MTKTATDNEARFRAERRAEVLRTGLPIDATDAERAAYYEMRDAQAKAKDAAALAAQEAEQDRAMVASETYPT
jgi:hypothetical protein